MEEGIQKNRYEDLEERTFRFAKKCRELIKLVPKTVASIEDGKQLARSSGSVAANYIEANEAISKKDFALRIKICRKEAKESRLWLRLIDCGEIQKAITLKEELLQESFELTKIFGAIVEKCK